jgi:hypothetical protein
VQVRAIDVEEGAAVMTLIEPPPVDLFAQEPGDLKVGGGGWPNTTV